MCFRAFTFCIVVGGAVALVGCGGTAPLSDPSSSGPPAHTLVYVIHGDGDYLYHENGTAKQADREALAEARLVAAHAPETEVFIFHQRSRQHLLGLIPRSGGTFYHYRDGTLLTEESYRREPSGSGLSREVALYREHRHPEASSSRTFLYYGHDIEEEGGTGYHASFPSHSFGLNELVDGLESFGAQTNPFDLVVLSTCNNGTPGTVAALAPLSRYVLASPGNLHLSHIDSHPLHGVASAKGGIDALAPQLADWAFERLDDRTETAVTLALYDTERLMPALEDLASSYAQSRARISKKNSPQADFVDCRDEMLPEMGPTPPGIQKWYQPPSFGRRSQKKTHSGWGCPRSERDAP